MSKPNKRRVKLTEFRAQLAEAVLPPDGVVTVDLDDDTSISFRIPLQLDDDDPYLAAIKAASGADEMLHVLLSEEDAAIWTNAGNTADELMVLFGAESQGAQERMRDFRYRPSGR